MTVHTLLIFTVILLTSEKGYTLQCYECDSRLEPKCGKTWELSESEAEKYIQTCVGESVACRKLDSTDTIHGSPHAVRSCWNTSAPIEINKEFLTCLEMSLGNACYCNDNKGGLPCNKGHNSQNFSLILAVIILAALLVKSYII